MADPHARLEDGFPHGTVEGERAGCIGADCPAQPFTCAQIKTRYNTDWQFRQEYKKGLRGADLFSAIAERDAGLQPVVPPVVPRAAFSELSRVDQDDEIARRREAKESIASIAAWAGMTVGGIQYRVKTRALVRQRPRPIQAPELDPLEHEHSELADDVSSPTRFWGEEAPVPPMPEAPDSGTVPLIVAGKPQARLVQLWVVLDADDKLMMGAVRVEDALEYLAREVSA